MGKAAHTLPMPLPMPTPELVRSMAAAFDADRFTLARHRHRAVRLACETWPGNDDLARVLAKVVLVNRVFSTNLFHIDAMAGHIVSLAIDPALARGDVDVVELVARAPDLGRVKRAYSFATKYCAAHRPEVYQIYDANVEAALWAYQRRSPFGEFERSELWEYPSFIAVVDAFRGFFGLRDSSRVELDRFLWMVGQGQVA